MADNLLTGTRTTAITPDTMSSAVLANNAPSPSSKNVSSSSSGNSSASKSANNKPSAVSANKSPPTTSLVSARSTNNTDANQQQGDNNKEKKAAAVVHENNNSTHVHNNNDTNIKSNGHSSLLNGGDQKQKHNNVNGSDTVDKAAAVAGIGNDAKLICGVDEGQQTTMIIQSKDKEAHANGTTECKLNRTDGDGECRTNCSGTGGDSCSTLINDDSEDLMESYGEVVVEPPTTHCDITVTISDTTTTVGGTAGSGGVPAVMTNSDTLKKKQRLSSGRQQTKKAKRVRFYRNGDKFYPGLVIPVSYERYRSFESLTEDLTRVLGESIKVPGAVRTIFTVDGKKVASLDDLEDGKCYVCSCNNEVFKRLDYSSQNNKLNNRLSRVFRPSSPHKNGSPTIGGASGSGGLLSGVIANGAIPSPTVNLSERDTVVFPRIVTLIRNGVKPRRIFRLLLNKRNSPSFEHVLTAITQRVNLDTGCVRKVFSLDGVPVLSLADFFQHDVDVFYAYGNERVGSDDFDLDAEETRQINQLHKTLKTGRLLPGGQKPKMPVKSHNETFECCVDENFLMIGLQGNDSLPTEIKTRYTIGRIIGDGNFAVVLRVTEKATNQDYALKIIDKSKCLGKEHYIDAEIRIMKQLDHPHIISLISDRDTTRHMYLVMELVNGGDLFDAITRVTRFSEAQSRVMIKHLAAAMAYLHNMGIVHRDIKPENLLVELDEEGNVLMLKLADFGLACEVDEPLYAVCGTPTYVAPEILMETGYGLKIDVWAAGIILYILLCGFPPFVSPDNQQEPLFDAILSGVYEFPEPYWTDIGDGVRDLIANMLQSDPELRFSSEDILDHFWVLDEEPTSAVLQYH